MKTNWQTKNFRLGKKIKRGKESWNFFYWIFGVLIAVVISIIVILPINNWVYKIIIITISLFFLIWICLISAWWQNKLIGLKNKLENTWKSL